ncbi:hypothetical protein WJX74_009381 [Apatococcus lobatus]|uniref:Uncharacterized protein n=1 Tax=Apatococcus lobatus TaxID=904363 RepID=A0AAW1Q987_9CHLO
MPLQCPGTPDPPTGTQPTAAGGQQSAAELEAHVNAGFRAFTNSAMPRMPPQKRASQNASVGMEWAVSMAMSFTAMFDAPLVARVRKVSKIYYRCFGADEGKARVCLALCKCLKGPYDPNQELQLKAAGDPCPVTRAMLQAAQDMYREYHGEPSDRGLEEVKADMLSLGHRLEF